MNSVNLGGRLTKDAVLSSIKYGEENVSVSSFILALDRPRKKDKEHKADFVRVYVYGKYAETMTPYLTKGKQINLLGKLKSGSYINKDNIQIYTLDVVAKEIELIGGNSPKSESNNIPSSEKDNSMQKVIEEMSGGEISEDDIDIPF